jgi:aminopeptidase N
MLLTILLSLLAAPDVNASGGELIPEQAVYDVKDYMLVVTVDPERKFISGIVTMTFRTNALAPRIALDLDDRFQLRDVTAPREADVVHEDGRIWIDFETPLPKNANYEVSVSYAGVPREAPRPPWDGGFTWSESKRGKPWVATSCQGEGADIWWPCKDHPSDKADTMTIIATVPKGLFCASNGVLVDDDRKNHGHTYTWKVSSPISPYNVALNIGPFDELKARYKSVSGDTIPVHFWVLPESKKKAKKALPEFLEHLAFMEELCGPYPFRAEKYGIVETPHLGMEHQTIIAYGNKFAGGPFDYDWLHHHELSHEWWGNLVTCRDWKDMWLHEGFGTYMQALYTERKLGQEGLTSFMKQKRRGLKNAKAVAPRKTQDSKQIYFAADGGFDNDIYDKGAWVLHTLRWLMGDEPFHRALRLMAYPDPALEEVTDGSQVRFADTEDFRAIAEEVHGADLSWFFEVYLRQPELPRLKIGENGRSLVLSWDVPKGADFPLPVPVLVGKELVRVPMPGGAGRLELSSKRYTVDPDLWLLRE